jgi:uracil-DNA glycosylase family 4
MRAALQAIAEELRRLKTSGVKTVAVSEESVAALRKIVAARAKLAPLAAPKPAGSAPAGSPLAPDQSALPARSAASGDPAPIKPYVPPAYTPSVARESAAAPGVAPIPAAPPTVTLPAGDKTARWAALKELVLNDPTCKGHVGPGKKVVLGVGTLDAKIMFVGEAPGGEEEVQGEPFVGPAGQLLTKMIQAMGLKREQVYIGNIMNWRPEMPTAPGATQVGNRPPTEEEMRYCLPYLRAQAEIVNPDVLVALGKTALEGLLGFGKFKTLGEARGRWHEFGGKPLMVTYHPSYILREPTNRKKRLIWDDLLQVMERTGLPISEKQRGFFLDK